ncbi:MAG: biotin--[acetyl-CoA-carboxylase] ligase [Bacteroidaceae bacterium]|nr:biotin--[acetyl-CoA-carboxylase] ligase [Bacteroidaceae bacterium]
MDSDFPGIECTHLSETESTNSWLRQQPNDGKIRLAWADYQTSGRGQKGNHWESEAGKNLLFTIGIPSPPILPNEQFLLSQCIATSICRGLQEATHRVFQVKWPNDIYFREQKLGGILIEHQIHHGSISRSLAGIGLNVNQARFLSNAPNPVSLCQVTGRPWERTELLTTLLHFILKGLDSLRQGHHDSIRLGYWQLLYRREGVHPFCDAQGTFLASITAIEDGGRLHLKDTNGRVRSYDFKEVQFILPHHDAH